MKLRDSVIHQTLPSRTVTELRQAEAANEFDSKRRLYPSLHVVLRAHTLSPARHTTHPDKAKYLNESSYWQHVQWRDSKLARVQPLHSLISHSAQPPAPADETDVRGRRGQTAPPVHRTA